MYTVDASVWVNAFDHREPGHLVSRQFLDALRSQASPIIVPNLVLVEVAGAISRTRSATEQAQAFALALSRLPHVTVRVLDEVCALQALKLAAQHGPPSNMVYMVYADQEGFVFDWDWVKENPGELGHPIDSDLRSGDPVANPPETILEVPGNLAPGTFDASKACYSRTGDCIFCYLSDTLAYAERINPDLTIFREFESNKVAGFKVKNVQRILQQDKNVILSDVPDLIVSVAGILLATYKLNKDANVEVYNIIIEAYWRSPHQPRQVKLPKPESKVSESATC